MAESFLDIAAKTIRDTIGVPVLYISGDYTAFINAVPSIQSTGNVQQTQYKQNEIKNIFDRPLVSRPSIDWLVCCCDLPFAPQKGDMIQHTNSGARYQVVPDENGETYRFDNDIERNRMRIHTRRISE